MVTAALQTITAPAKDRKIFWRLPCMAFSNHRSIARQCYFLDAWYLVGRII
jgi:hypothetical protein